RFVVLSQDHGVEKPDPRIFEIALDRAGCSSEELLHVGDSLETDIEGANRAEIRSVWLNRQGLERGHETKVDIEIRSLSELLDILGDR
ncbi:MAG: HAD-IA family hydrolase, partial [Candidatus Bathyarchaeota archaeon]